MFEIGQLCEMWTSEEQLSIVRPSIYLCIHFWKGHLVIIRAFPQFQIPQYRLNYFRGLLHKYKLDKCPDCQGLLIL